VVPDQHRNEKPLTAIVVLSPTPRGGARVRPGCLEFVYVLGTGEVIFECQPSRLQSADVNALSRLCMGKTAAKAPDVG
jgi:hypothetical protein